MIDVSIPHDEIVDPPARRASAEFPWWNRDQCRTPMQWTGAQGVGFTTGRPWLRIGPDAATRNVAAQTARPDSVLATYRRLLAARRGSEALRLGSFRRVPVPGGDVLAYHRRTDTDEALVLVNFSTDPRLADWSGDESLGGPWRSLVGTHRHPTEPGPDSSISLRTLEGVVLVRS
jgi:glycosidase